MVGKPTLIRFIMEHREMPLIRDIMSKIVVSIRPDATLIDAVKVLTKHHLSGAPVVSAAGEVIGFISEPNLMDVLFDQDSRTRKVSDYMSPEVQLLHVNDSIATAATMFAMYGFRRLPVVEDGRLIGVVTRRDLLAHSLVSTETFAEPLMELIPGLAEYA
jgi:CBS domain-containing protein